MRPNADISSPGSTSIVVTRATAIQSNPHVLPSFLDKPNGHRRWRPTCQTHHTPHTHLEPRPRPRPQPQPQPCPDPQQTYIIPHPLAHSTQPTHPPQDSAWKAKEQSDEAHWARQKVRSLGTRSNIYSPSHALQEEEQLAQLRASMDLGSRPFQSSSATSDRRDEIEGGHGGQEELEDRYATTSGEH